MKGTAIKEYGLDSLTVSRLAALRRVFGFQRLCAGFLSSQPHRSLLCLFVLFSTPLFYPQVPSMDRCRIRSVLSPDDCSNGPLVHSLRSVRIRIRTFLLGLREELQENYFNSRRIDNYPEKSISNEFILIAFFWAWVNFYATGMFIVASNSSNKHFSPASANSSSFVQLAYSLDQPTRSIGGTK